VAEIGEERSGEEVLKLRFEFFKHMTTVSTASTAAVIAVYGLSEKALRGAVRLSEWPGWMPLSDRVILYIPGFAIGGFFLSLLLSLWGLYLVAKAQYTGQNSAAISRISKWSAATFILGVGISAATAGLIVAGPRRAVVLASFFLALAGLIVTYLGIRQSSEAAQQAQALAAAAEAAAAEEEG
jgi:hypothetical protein